MIPLTTADFSRRARTVHAHRLAAVDEPGVPGSLGRLTYGELFERCDGFKRALTRLGIGDGERVAIVSPNCAKFLIMLFGLAETGRVLVPINYRLSADEVQFIVDDSEASLLLVDAEIDQRLSTVRAPKRIVLDGEADAELFAPVPLATAPQEIAESQPASINYTSGTTAVPKGVVLTHRSQWLNAVLVGWQLGLTGSDCYLHTLPQFHVNGWGLPLAAAAMGIPNIVQRTVRGPEILRRVEQEDVTLLCGPAAVSTTIADAAQSLRASGSPVPGDGTTRMVSGGAPTPGAVIHHFETVTGWELIHAYGTTEAGPVLTINRLAPRPGSTTAADRATRLTAAGPPLLGVDLRVAENGEVQARTAKTMAGYWRRPDLTDATFTEHWLNTGDAGRIDDGVLTITDRLKDIVVTGGENVSTAEVEALILKHPAVQDVAVIAVADELRGETPKALVVLRDDAEVDEEELTAFCRARLAHFKCPTSFDFRASLPRTATGKVQKYLLRAEYGGGKT